MDFFRNVSILKNDDNHLILIINEDVKAGTTIDLNQITDVDTSFVQKLNALIDEKKDRIYNERIKAKSDELKSEYDERLKAAKQYTEERIKAVKQEASEYYSKIKEAEISKIETENQKNKNEIINNYDQEIQRLNNSIANAELNKNNEINEIKEKYRQAIYKQKEDSDKAIRSKDEEINGLKTSLALSESEKSNALSKLELEYKGKIEIIERENNEKIKLKDNLISQQSGEIESLKNYRSSLSTKGVGEDLEQWCYNEFNKNRSLAFKNATFQKDNDTNNESGTKGDFIYRDKDEYGYECISIMFEMKNQTDSNGKKHKNEDFFEKLDRDRNNKNCEYAVLVSMLEPENEYYNVGIQDVSYKYPKMYVIRPQFLLPLISILKNEALKSAEDRRALQEERQKSIDITNFEEKINKFKENFKKQYEKAGDKFKVAIDDIDKAIKKLMDTKEALLASQNALSKADDTLDSLTIKKLTHNNPTMKALFKNQQQQIEDKSDH